jgi:hypothetical protein
MKYGFCCHVEKHFVFVLCLCCVCIVFVLCLWIYCLLDTIAADCESICCSTTGSERVEGSEGSYWQEVDPKISYRKIGHVFRSSSRRRTAEKNAEVAIAEEAGRTRKSYEDVKARINVEPFKSPLSIESRKNAVADYGSAPSFVLPKIGIAGDVVTAKKIFPPVNTPSPPSSTEQLLQLEVKRKLLLEEERRLFEMRCEASLRSRAPLPTVEPILYGATIRDPMISPANMHMQRRLQSSMVDQRSILTNSENSSTSHARMLGDVDHSLLHFGVPSLRRPYWMT